MRNRLTGSVPLQAFLRNERSLPNLKRAVSARLSMSSPYEANKRAPPFVEAMARGAEFWVDTAGSNGQSLPFEHFFGHNDRG